jgi:hypothetical protein
MAQISIQFAGTSPLLCHNIQLSDPDNPWAEEIKIITSKRKKTEEDRRAIERLEWYGGLYTDADMSGPVMPTGNIRKCLVEAAKITKRGKDIIRSLAFTDMVVPLVYDGPRDIDKMFADKKFHNRASVKVGMSRVMRVRPQFPQWSITADAILLEDVMDFDDLQRIIERAGLAEGMGDNRVNGFGRFTGQVVMQ